MSPDYWNAVRAFYKDHHERIMKSRSEWGVDPYAWEVDAGVQMTPIEAALWSDIRMEGAVFYPQYPVDKFFVDFGNPVAKVALECDGYAFHLDKAKDAARDARLHALGWAVYRFPGHACVKDTVEREDEDGHPVIELSPARLKLRQLINDHQIRIGTGRPATPPFFTAKGGN